MTVRDRADGDLVALFGVDIKLPVLCATRGSEYLYEAALVVLVGLACKAILIVEFADEGEKLVDAASTCRMRLRRF
jgi:hypothetical protein